MFGRLFPYFRPRTNQLYCILSLLAIYLLYFHVSKKTTDRQTYVSEFNLKTPIDLYNFPFSRASLAAETFFELREFNQSRRNSWIEERLELISGRSPFLDFGVGPDKNRSLIVRIIAPRTYGEHVFVVGVPLLDVWNLALAIGMIENWSDREAPRKYFSRDVVFVFCETPLCFREWIRHQFSDVGVSEQGIGRIWGVVTLEQNELREIGEVSVLESIEVIPRALPNLDLMNVMVKTAYEYDGRAVVEFGGYWRSMWKRGFAKRKKDDPTTLIDAVKDFHLHGVGIRPKFASISSSDTPVREKPLEVMQVALWAFGNVLDTALHHYHNADEDLHQSFGHYFLTTATTFLENEHFICLGLWLVAHLSVLINRSNKKRANLLPLFNVLYFMTYSCHQVSSRPARIPFLLLAFPFVETGLKSTLPRVLVRIFLCSLWILVGVGIEMSTISETSIVASEVWSVYLSCHLPVALIEESGFILRQLQFRYRKEGRKLKKEAR